MPDPLSLRLTWNNGSLPPPYRKSGVVTLKADGSGTNERFKSYDREVVSSHEFHLTPPEAEALALALEDLGLWRIGWAKPEKPVVGGSTSTVSAMWGERATKIPFIVCAEQAEAKREIIRTIREVAQAESDD